MIFDPNAILGALQDAGVEYVVVVGLAAVLHGSPLPTVDVDVVPKRDTWTSRLSPQALAMATTNGIVTRLTSISVVG